MAFPTLDAAQRIRLLEPPAGPVRMVLDTDTYNEIDDQFALAYTLLSPERIVCEAIYAAPFQNDRGSDPEAGMLASYDEILRLLERLGRSHEGFVFNGSTSWLPGADQPVQSAAVDDLIARARAERDGPLYVVAIGAITNVASALLQAPDILSKLVVVWLGGNPQYWERATEFNVYQDMHAARVIFDSGVPLVHVPCLNVTEHLRTTQAELDRFVKGRSAIGDYLCRIFAGDYDDHYARSVLVPSPILTTAQTWSHDPHRHLIREVRSVKRDPIFADLFRKLEGT
jgi:hypothetical protein